MAYISKQTPNTFALVIAGQIQHLYGHFGSAVSYPFASATVSLSLRPSPFIVCVSCSCSVLVCVYACVYECVCMICRFGWIDGWTTNASCVELGRPSSFCYIHNPGECDCDRGRVDTHKKDKRQQRPTSKCTTVAIMPPLKLRGMSFSIVLLSLSLSAFLSVPSNPPPRHASSGSSVGGDVLVVLACEVTVDSDDDNVELVVSLSCWVSRLLLPGTNVGCCA